MLFIGKWELTQEIEQVVLRGATNACSNDSYYSKQIGQAKRFGTNGHWYTWLRLSGGLEEFTFEWNNFVNDLGGRCQWLTCANNLELVALSNDAKSIYYVRSGRRHGITSYWLDLLNYPHEVLRYETLTPSRTPAASDVVPEIQSWMRVQGGLYQFQHKDIPTFIPEVNIIEESDEQIVFKAQVGTEDWNTFFAANVKGVNKLILDSQDVELSWKLRSEVEYEDKALAECIQVNTKIKNSVMEILETNQRLFVSVYRRAVAESKLKRLLNLCSFAYSGEIATGNILHDYRFDYSYFFTHNVDIL